MVPVICSPDTNSAGCLTFRGIKNIFSTKKCMVKCMRLAISSVTKNRNYLASNIWFTTKVIYKFIWRLNLEEKIKSDKSMNINYNFYQVKYFKPIMKHIHTNRILLLLLKQFTILDKEPHGRYCVYKYMS